MEADEPSLKSGIFWSISHALRGHLTDMLLVVETVVGTLTVLAALGAVAVLWVLFGLSVPDYEDRSMLGSEDDGHMRAANREARWYDGGRANGRLFLVKH